MIQIYKKFKEFLGSYRIITKAQLQQEKLAYCELLLEANVLQNEKEAEEEEAQSDLVTNKSGSILIEFDAETGDFGVMASVDDTSEMCVKILALLMVHMSSGDITPFVYESLVGWAVEDEEKMDFNERLGVEIIALTTEITKDRKNSKKTAAIKASEVFNYRKKD